MDFENVKQKLSDAYTAVQNLQIQPIKGNIDLLSAILNNLGEAFAIIENTERDAKSAEEKKEEE